MGCQPAGGARQMLRSKVEGVAGLVLGSSWKRQGIVEYQTRRLRALVEHAYQRVPFYRRLFDQVGLKPADVRTLQDLSHIPPTSRAAMQDALAEDLLARGFDPRRLDLQLTSGSSGQPLNIRRTAFEATLSRLYRLRVLRSVGLRFTDRRAAIVPCEPPVPAPARRRWGILPYVQIPCTLPPRQILAKLRQFRPDVLRGYPVTLSWLADCMTDADRSEIRPRFITTDSETLTSDARARIQAGFGSQVLDFYDSWEFNLIAWECPAGGQYHVADTWMIVEVLSNGQAAAPGEEGELVGTALHNWAMPFIRYKLGDIVLRASAPCPCGASNSVLERVQGRQWDRFVLPDGSSVHPNVLVTPLVEGVPWIRRYQVVQEEVDRIRIKLVPMPHSNPSPETVARVGRMLAGRLEGIRLEIELVDEIPLGPNGKHRPYYSLVKAVRP